MSEKVKFNPRTELEDFLSDKQVIFHDENIYMYSDGYYKPITDRVLVDDISLHINDSYGGRLNYSKEVLELMKCNLSKNKINFNKNPNLINCKNGILNIRKMELLPHSPEIVFINQINASYNPFAECPIFDKYIHDTIVNEKFKYDKDLAEQLLMYMGYCLMPVTTYEKALVLLGSGSNGKTILKYVFEQLFKGSASSVHFEEINKDMFATAELAGKMINISSELSKSVKLKENWIKNIVTGGNLRAQKKFRDAFVFHSTVKHIIDTNHLPSSEDTSFAYSRRFLIIPFRQLYLPKNEIDKIKECIKSDTPFILAEKKETIQDNLKSELDGIFFKIVESLVRLQKNKGFNDIQQALISEMFRENIDTSEMFARTNFKQDLLSKLKFKDIYEENYVAFCRKVGHSPESKKVFSKRLKELNHEVRVASGNDLYIHGVSLNKTKVHTPKFVFDDIEEF